MPDLATPDPTWRDAWVEIDLSAVVGNLAALAAICPPTTELMPVVKADAYGHGAVPIARALAAAGVPALCVATIPEAIELRRAGLDGRLICLYEAPAAAWPEARALGIELTIGSVEGLEAALAHVARGPGGPGFQLAIDSGMTRQGLRVDRLAVLRERLIGLARDVAGIWTHLADGADRLSTGHQLERFDAAVDLLRAWGLEAPRHAAASAAIVAGFAVAYEAVRPGLAMYGLTPAELAAHGGGLPAALRPVMAIRARPSRLVEVPRGTPVGYGGTFVTRRRTSLATLALGYADGYARALGGGVGAAIVEGRRAPVVGRVSMDSCAVDVTDVPGVTRSSVFTFLGSAGAERITIEELAERCGTIPHEVAVRFGARLIARPPVSGDSRPA